MHSNVVAMEAMATFERNDLKLCVVERLKMRFLKTIKHSFWWMRLKADWYAFTEMWDIVPSDCRLELIKEFLFNPQSLRNRFQEEIRFTQNIRKWERHER
jgi:hypothetical protein